MFRAIVRLVLEFIEWLTEEIMVEEITDDVAISIKMTSKLIEKKVDKKVLTLQVCEKEKKINKMILS